MDAVEQGDELLGCVALKERSSAGGEIKSMRTSSAARGRGVGTRLLQHVVDESRQRGYRQLELETGTQEFFDPARRLYAKFGFVPCPPFGNYREDRTAHSSFSPCEQLARYSILAVMRRTALSGSMIAVSSTSRSVVHARSLDPEFPATSVVRDPGCRRLAVQRVCDARRDPNR